MGGTWPSGVSWSENKQLAEQMAGSGALVRWLLDNDLVDEMNLLIVPVVLGQGTRLFPDAGPGHCARPGRLASRLEGRNDPGLPAQRPPAACNRLKHVTLATQSKRVDHRRVRPAAWTAGAW